MVAVGLLGGSGASADCPCTIWSAGSTPVNPSEPDPNAVELGVKFRSDVAGQVTGVRFYKGTGNTGTHVGKLWTSSGTLLASAIFTGETASGWQQVSFAAPVSIAANTTYVASYYAPNGHYAGDENSFGSDVVNAPLRALASGGGSGPNGVYNYGVGGGFPNESFNSTNYWVDVVFSASGAPTATPTPNAPTATPTPNAPTATPTRTPTTTSNPIGIWSSSTTPSDPSVPDSNAVELGVKFRSSVAGQVTGIQFYKGSGNTGTHVGKLWSRTGTLLASATFAGETASGWQQVSFAAPVSIAANTTYVASYYAPNGNYAGDNSYFAGSGVTNGPLTALAGGVDGPNGVYNYGVGGGFPDQSYQSTNYWVDVVFVSGVAPTATPTPNGPTNTPTRTPTQGANPTNTPTRTPTTGANPTNTPIPTATPTNGPIQSGFTTIEELELASTFQSISVYSNYSGDGDRDNTASLQWRRVGESTWRNGMAMTADRRATVTGNGGTWNNPFANQWRASVLMLQPNTAYEVRVTYSDPDGVSGGTSVTGTITTRNENPPSNGTTYYVAANGADTNPGTSASPWRTLQKAANTVVAGDRVLVRAGTYSAVSISRSGNANNFIYFKNDVGARPIVSAAAGAGTLVNITGSYVRFEGFELVGGQFGFLVGTPAHDVMISDNVIRGWRPGGQEGVAVQMGDTFSVQNPVANVTVEDNDIRVDTLPESETNVILSKASSGGHVIRRNRIVFFYQGGAVHGTDCIGGLPNFAPHGGFFKDTDVNDNFCDGATDEGVELDGGNANVRVWGNTILNTNLGFSTTPTFYGPTYVFRNVLADLKDHWVGSCVAMKDGETGTGAVYFYHNTFYSPSGANCNNILKGFAKYGSGAAQTNSVLKNNIFHYWGRLYETGGKTADYNLNFVEPGSGDKVAEWNGANYFSFSSFQSGANQEANGLWGRATFVNAGARDYNLTAGSMGVDDGTVLAGFNDANSGFPFTGSAPDMGAFERP